MSSVARKKVIRENAHLLQLIPLEAGGGQVETGAVTPPVCFEEFWKLSDCMARKRMSGECVVEYTSFLICLRAHGIFDD